MALVSNPRPSGPQYQEDIDEDRCLVIDPNAPVAKIKRRILNLLLEYVKGDRDETDEEFEEKWPFTLYKYKMHRRDAIWDSQGRLRIDKDKRSTSSLNEHKSLPHVRFWVVLTFIWKHINKIQAGEAQSISSRELYYKLCETEGIGKLFKIQNDVDKMVLSSVSILYPFHISNQHFILHHFCLVVICVLIDSLTVIIYISHHSSFESPSITSWCRSISTWRVSGEM